MAIEIYHNPRCSKSRATLTILRDRGIEPVIIDYLRTPPSAATLKRLCGLLDRRPAELVRFNEASARERNLAAGDPRTDEAWCALISAHPELLERPIVVVDGVKAALGRPPENVQSIL